MTEDQAPYELVRLNPYRIWKLLQPRPPEIYQRDRLTIVPDEPGKDEDENKSS